MLLDFATHCGEHALGMVTSGEGFANDHDFVGGSPKTGEQDSDIPGVKTHIAYLRQYGELLYLGVAFTNTSASFAGVVL